MAYELPEGLVRLGLFEWRRALLGRRLVQASTLTFGFFVAAYGDTETGSRIFPGQKAIKEDAGYGNEEAVRGHLRKLEAAGLFLRVGESSSRHERAREYVLTVPEDVALAAGFTGLPPKTGGRRVSSPPETGELNHRKPTPSTTGNREPTSSVPPQVPPPPARASAREPWRGEQALVERIVEALGDVTAEQVEAGIEAMEADPSIRSAAAVLRSWLEKGSLVKLRSRLTSAAARAPVRAPGWCGECAGSATGSWAERVVWLADDRSMPCPSCHPSAVPRAS